jgi:hypothetical protein
MKGKRWASLVLCGYLLLALLINRRGVLVKLMMAAQKRAVNFWAN